MAFWAQSISFYSRYVAQKSSENTQINSSLPKQPTRDNFHLFRSIDVSSKCSIEASVVRWHFVLHVMTWHSMSSIAIAEQYVYYIDVALFHSIYTSQTCFIIIINEWATSILASTTMTMMTTNQIVMIVNGEQIHENSINNKIVQNTDSKCLYAYYFLLSANFTRTLIFTRSQYVRSINPFILSNIVRRRIFSRVHTDRVIRKYDILAMLRCAQRLAYDAASNKNVQNKN